MFQLSPLQRSLLISAHVGHLATANSEGIPHVIPVCFTCDGDTIYSVLDQKPKRAALTRLRRVRNIMENPNIALVVDHYEDDWGRLWYILLTGTAQLMLDGEERIKSIGLLRSKYHQYRDMDIDSNPVIKIVPSRVVSWGIKNSGAI